MGQSIQETARQAHELELGLTFEPELPPRVCEEIEAILAETGASARSADSLENARRRVLGVLVQGDRCREEDLSILDELERRARFARLTAKH